MFKELFLIAVMVSLCYARPERKGCSPSQSNCEHKPAITPGFGTLGLGGAAPSFAGPNGQNILPDSENGNPITNIIDRIRGNEGDSVAGVGMSYAGYKG